MDELPSNSLKAKTVSNEAAEPKLVEKVVSGTAVRRKKPLGKRFAETFFGGSAKNVLDYVLREILLPAVKDTVADAISQGAERMIFGEGRSTSRRTGARPSKAPDYVSYNRMSSRSSAPWNREPREEPRNVSRRARGSHDFGEIVLATRIEANTVIDRLIDLTDRYHEATVADLYQLVGIDSEHTDDRWGWEFLDHHLATIRRTRDGYVLELPQPEPLER